MLYRTTAMRAADISALISLVEGDFDLDLVECDCGTYTPRDHRSAHDNVWLCPRCAAREADAMSDEGWRD